MAMQDIETNNGTRFSDRDFEAGLAKLMPFLRIFSQSLSRNRELAEDLTQAACMKAWQSRRSFMPGTNLKAWLCVILRNEFYSHQRRAWRQTPWDVALGENIAAPAREQEWAVDLSDAACAMNELPQSQREALILVGVGGLTSHEVAALSRCAVGTVKSRVGRARYSLREILESRKAGPNKQRPAHGNAMNELLNQLQHLGGSGPTPAHAMSA